MSQLLREAWRALLNDPLGFIDGQCLDAALLGALPAGQAAGLAQQPRFQARIERLLASYYGLQPLSACGEVADADLPVLLLPVERFSRLPLFCGACRHGTSLAREIRGSAVQQLRSQLGAEVYELAVAWRDAAGQQQALSGEALFAAIERDGLACVQAWLAAQPSELQPWLRLRFDLGAALSTGNAADVQHMRRVAAALPDAEQRGAA